MRKFFWDDFQLHTVESDLVTVNIVKIPGVPGLVKELEVAVIFRF